MQKGYTIVPAQAAHLPELQAIEYAAGKMFTGWGFPQSLIEHEMPMSMLREGLERQLLWVALSAEGIPVGFALLERFGHLLHLEELDVDPGHGRRGIGTGLVNTVCDWGRAQACLSMTLTTFRHIPWNMPFYEKLNFRVLAEHQLTQALRDRVQAETVKGIEPGLRVVMERLL